MDVQISNVSRSFGVQMTESKSEIENPKFEIKNLKS